jgi:SAM-dependent methyltransferase
MSNRLVTTLYNARTITQWQSDRTMQHSSGIWGREPVLRFLRENLLHAGDVVVDLGAGGGYPSLQISGRVGPAGRVIGLELSEAMVAAARTHCRAENLAFDQADVTTKLPLECGTVDAVTSFMVLHNLRLQKMATMFREVARILKGNGRAVFLTMHPDAFESDWQLDFLSYDADALRQHRNGLQREDREIPGRAKNACGGENEVLTVYHGRDSVLAAARCAGLALAHEQDLWIDAPTAVAVFGPESIKRLPKNPIYWMLVLKRNVPCGTELVLTRAQPATMIGGTHAQAV